MYLWLFSQRVPLLAQQDVEDDDAGCVQQRLCKARRDERQDAEQTRNDGRREEGRPPRAGREPDQARALEQQERRL